MAVREGEGAQDRGSDCPYANGMEYAIFTLLMGLEVFLDLHLGPVYIRASEKVTFFTHV